MKSFSVINEPSYCLLLGCHITDQNGIDFFGNHALQFLVLEVSMQDLR